MPNKIQPRPGDGADEKTIEKNLKEMEYDSKDDIMRHGDVVDPDITVPSEDVSSIDQVSKEDK